MSCLRLSDMSALVACNAITGLLEDGLAPGYLKIFGTHNLYIDILLAQFTLPLPAFKAAIMEGEIAVAEANFIEPTIGFMAAGKGTLATHFEVTNSEEEVCWRGDISEMGGKGDLQFENPIIAKDRAVSILAWKFKVSKNGR